MVGTIDAGAASVVAVPTVAGLAWRRTRQRKVDPATCLSGDVAKGSAWIYHDRSVFLCRGRAPGTSASWSTYAFVEE
jgi:hypothetical protein